MTGNPDDIARRAAIQAELRVLLIENAVNRSTPAGPEVYEAEDTPMGPDVVPDLLVMVH